MKQGLVERHCWILTLSFGKVLFPELFSLVLTQLNFGSSWGVSRLLERVDCARTLTTSVTDQNLFICLLFLLFHRRAEVESFIKFARWLCCLRLVSYPVHHGGVSDGMELHRIHSHFILSFTVFLARSVEQDQRLYLLIAKVSFKIDLFLSCSIFLRKLLLFWRRFG